MPARRLRGLRIHARRRHLGLQRAQHVGLVRRKEKIGLERIEIVIGAASAREDPALDAKPRLVRRAEHSQAGHGIVLGKNHDLNAVRSEGEQLLHQRKGDALARGHVETGILQRDVRALAVALENPVLLFEVEQRSRRDRDDELPFHRVRQWLSPATIISS
jgi:hypothetical protein